MKKSRFTETQIVSILKQADTGSPVKDICRQAPFRLGVASGSPTASSVVLWTRLCPDVMHDGGMGVQQVPLRWVVATDEAFGNVVRRGEWFAMAGRVHSVHVTVDGLHRIYRFMAGNDVSPTGGTRTLSLANAAPSRLRFALASCQHTTSSAISQPVATYCATIPISFASSTTTSTNTPRQRTACVRAHAEPEPYMLAEYRSAGGAASARSTASNAVPVASAPAFAPANSAAPRSIASATLRAFPPKTSAGH